MRNKFDGRQSYFLGVLVQARFECVETRGSIALGDCLKPIRASSCFSKTSFVVIEKTKSSSNTTRDYFMIMPRQPSP